ncbi:VOC family protein [Nocardia sp. CNY236]|uniref:VOC family protein n=1 Tax=Nocardia sp. CNY236 TaxID=1169152 RepID=UPI000416B79C|nr:VOC family protein [Nocardia sp. CNY236]
MPIESLHHVGYVVARMGPALTRWLAEGARILVEPVEDLTLRVTVALLETDGVLPVELVAPISADGSPVAARLRRGGGLDHLCFCVPDLHARLECELARGAILLRAPVLAVAFRREVGFVQRRSGLVVEFIATQEVHP